METTVTKVCKECGRELPLSAFRPNHKSKDGHLNTCKCCMSKKMKGKQEEELLEEIVGKDAVEQADKGFPVTQDKYDRLQEYTAQDLVDYLRFQGWEVTCTRVISL